VQGKITRITPFGAFVQLSPSVEALVHVSEMSDDASIDPESLFKLNETKEFKVLDIDTANRKIALSLKDLKGGSKSSDLGSQKKKPAAKKSVAEKVITKPKAAAKTKSEKK